MMMMNGVLEEVLLDGRRAGETGEEIDDIRTVELVGLNEVVRVGDADRIEVSDVVP